MKIKRKTKQTRQSKITQETKEKTTGIKVKHHQQKQICRNINYANEKERKKDRQKEERKKEGGKKRKEEGKTDEIKTKEKKKE